MNTQSHWRNPDQGDQAKWPAVEPNKHLICSFRLQCFTTFCSTELTEYFFTSLAHNMILNLQGKHQLKFLRNRACNCTLLQFCTEITVRKSKSQSLEFSTFKAYQRKLRLNLNIISSKPWRNKSRY